ncbi:MAG: hypothetical protein EA413_09245 [Cyanobium sp. PLM2.Bin73]|nr:MAG: hypothetical protein EA413_09245 [Cyanobium sp. PLM2.Bin73]
MGTGPVRVVVAGGAGGQWPRMLRALLSGVLVLALLATAGCSRLGRDRGAPGLRPLETSGPAGRLQEVAPPPAVQQLRQALDQRRPQLAITAPQDGSLLPSGPWTLRLSGSDWPLTDAGALGLGAHLALQVDDGPPRRLTAETGPGERFELGVPMDPLPPGSHRITATVVRPWGEVVKGPGASAQIRLHRVARNPLALPAPGSPQLIVASPAELTAAEPLLLDWLLLDAPLQGLREGDARWRLRVTINGDSFLVDQNAPLWLKGWRNGSNSLLMELVDERGEPLNPPFNAVVREVIVEAGTARPRWQGGALSEQELAQLLGMAPAPAPEPASAEEPEAAPEPEPEQEPEQEPPDKPEQEQPEEALSPQASAPPPAPAAPPPASEPEAEQPDKPELGA